MTLPRATSGRQLSPGCICGKRMFEFLNEGTCLWCGRGRAHTQREIAWQRNMEHNAPAGEARVVELRVGRVVKWTEDACVTAYRRWTAAMGRTPAPREWMGAAHEGEVARPSFATITARFGSWQGFLRYIADVPREQAA